MDPQVHRLPLWTINLIWAINCHLYGETGGGDALNVLNKEASKLLRNSCDSNVKFVID